MIFGLLILAVALFISAVAAFYSIAGLSAIFAAAVTPIIIMGLALEIGKIAATVWLHKYWHRVAVQFKLYLVPAILVLMLITSMGIFGFLSKAHMDQTVPAGDVAAQVTILDEKIATERANIDANKKALTQMDSQVDQILGRTTDDKGATKAAQLRKSQSKERKSLQNDISASQKAIATIQAERAPIAAEVRKVEAEVGPIKYIAALIYGDNPDSNLLERAVRWVIILLVFVFDPLAIVLILAADQTFIWAKEDKQKKKEEDEPAYETDDGPLTEEEINTINVTAGKEDVVMTERLFDTEEEFFEAGKEVAHKLDNAEPESWSEIIAQKMEHAKELDKHAYLTSPWTWMKNTDGPQGYVPTAKEEIITSNISPDELYDFIDEGRTEDSAKQDLDNAISLIAEMQTKLDTLQIEHDAKHEELEQIKSTVITDHLGNPINVVFPNMHPKLEQVTAPDLSINAEITGNSVNAGFGTTFPKTPVKGDLYLRVDYLPSKLYKWNDIKWIEVDKTTTDIYSYDLAYIQHLVAKLASGEYDPEQLTLAEQEQIRAYVNDSSQT
jgi:hypothetical protein